MYPRKFTKSRIYAAVILIFVLAFCGALAVDLVTPRVPAATFMTYQLATGVSSALSNYIYFFVYIVPSGTVSIVTLIKLRLLISKHNAQVQPAQSDVMNKDQSAVGGIFVKPIQKTLKMICLVSGTFWLTVIPGIIIRASLRGSGVTWADTDHRVSLPMFALARTSYLMVTVLSSFLNPIIYMAVLTELREAVWKRIGIKRNNSVVPNWAIWVSMNLLSSSMCLKCSQSNVKQLIRIYKSTYSNYCWPYNWVVYQILELTPTHTWPASQTAVYITYTIIG